MSVSLVVSDVTITIFHLFSCPPLAKAPEENAVVPLAEGASGQLLFDRESPNLYYDWLTDVNIVAQALQVLVGFRIYWKKINIILHILM